MANKNTKITRKTSDSTPEYHTPSRAKSGTDTATSVDGLLPAKGSVIVGRNSEEWSAVAGGNAGDVITKDPSAVSGAAWAPASGDFDDDLLVATNGTRPLTSDWDNTGRRIRNTGIAEVSTDEPADPAEGLIWVDLSAQGTSGSGFVAQRDITASITLDTADNVIWVDAVGGNIVVTLMTAAGNRGRQFTIKRVDTNSGATVTVAAASGESIEWEPDYEISSFPRGQSITVTSNNIMWGIQ